MPDNTDKLEGAVSLSLREIAAWTPGVCPDVQSRVRARIPALQRGLVWKPEQNELLWDSILRGFPIGALVVTKYSEQLRKISDTPVDNACYHLLDGQQRCNAIMLGFDDPFCEDTRNRPDGVGCILWLDLDPPAASNSTRCFWVRATTTAHPWGYSRNDSASPLNVGCIRNAVQRLGIEVAAPDYRRPKPTELWPSCDSARTPVPLSWLMLSATDGEDFWGTVAQRAAQHGNLRWTTTVQAYCARTDNLAMKTHILAGVKRAIKAQVIALEAPDDLLEASEQERVSESNKDDVSNIEQLFQRLNQQGTKLDGEELAFSMIKAYWRELEEPVNKASECRMPSARMASLSVRAALAKTAKQNMPGPQSVGAIRDIARGNEAKKTSVETFIASDLEHTCATVDRWLKYDKNSNPGGMLPVHITSIGMNSRDVYLLLLHLASRTTEAIEASYWSKRMQALATLLHWFASDKTKAANRVFEACRDEVSVTNIRIGLLNATDKGDLHVLQTPDELASFIVLPEANIAGWDWWKLICKENDAEGNEVRRKGWEGMLNLRGNRELLLYAQRHFLAQRWSDYNPARRDLWESHNRPWDFDHILAHAYFYNRKDNSPCMGLCQKWGNTIGNLRAWPFEDNRSDQMTLAKDKIKGDVKVLAACLMTAEEEMSFSRGNDVRKKETEARIFIDACQSRLVRIFREWYDSMELSELLPAFKGVDVATGIHTESITMEQPS
jgi:hypothetical protein